MRFIMLMLLAATSNLYAQKGSRYFTQNDPMVGEWKFNADSTGQTTAAPLFKGEEILIIAPGIEVGMAAKSHDKLNGYQKATYFTSKKDDTKIYCSVSESEYTGLEGKDFHFNYFYDKTKDTLCIIIHHKEYIYTRITKP